MPPTSAPSHPALLKLLPTSLHDSHVSIRVRTDKKMNTLITFALSSLRDQPSLPLVLHVFPSNSSSPLPSTSTQTLPPAPLPAPDPSATTSSNPTNSGAQKSVDALPKLVSIVEVIKREYITFLESLPLFGEEGKGKGKAMDLDEAGDGEKERKREGLHQYTLLTTFEAMGMAGSTENGGKGDSDKERERQELVAMNWLTGKAGKGKRPRVKHTPCMVIVLSTESVNSLDKTEFSHQTPLPLKLKKPKRAAADTEEVDERTKRRRRRTGKKAGKENNKDAAGKMSVDKKT